MSDDKKKKTMAFDFAANSEEISDILSKAEQIDNARGTSIKSILEQVNNENKKRKQIDKDASKKAPKLSFDVDPNYSDIYNGTRRKRRLLPNSIIKDISVQDPLIASILRARGNTMSMFGNFRKDRFDIGVELIIKPEFEGLIEPEQMGVVRDRMSRFKNLVINCGHTEGLDNTEKMSLSEYFYIQTINALRFGMIATEVVYATDDSIVDNPEENGKFYMFRPVDAGTIYKVYKKRGYDLNSVRRSSAQQLEEATGEKVDVPVPEDKDLDNNPYSWVQEIDGTRRQAFTDNELLVFNFYPSSDVEHNGYPLTPMDTCITSITTHLSIEAYNKLFFQNGRGAKGLMVVMSDEADQDVLDDLKQQYNASINDVTNAFRTPIIGVGKEDSVQWMSTESNAKDGEFQFLYDSVARNILAAFNMSPDELPGFSHLSRSTNSQTLSESNNEFKLTAARDTGLRPLILKWQEFINTYLLPVMDPELSQLCMLKLSGLDAQSRDQEAVRLQQETGLHMTYDEVLKSVDKLPVGVRNGGKVPFSERWQLIADKYMDVGEVISGLMEDPTASTDILLQFKRDPFFLQFMTVMMQINPDAIKARFTTRDDVMNEMALLIEDYLEELGEEDGRQ